MRFICLNKLGGTHISHDHAFFNELMRIIALNRHNIFNFALCIEHEFTFLSFKLNGTTQTTRFFQGAIQIMQIA